MMLAQNQDVSAMVNASEVTGQDANHSDCQTKVNRGLASLRCPKCGNVNATEIARYLSEILAYDKDEKAIFVLLGDVGPELTVCQFKDVNAMQMETYVLIMRCQHHNTITVTKIISIALLCPLPQAVEIQIMQVMIVTSFLGQV
ncbi:hypothetical protein Bca52824_087386 [Brassica carinata]|uniref:Uncharacterized protein n=1 Tax=Brassica carinata TaxID=52824 RepID=A0A8X7PBQ3_BRACI|nr:hypothetical protein Bca52824_087386 [Brassica carinata]